MLIDVSKFSILWFCLKYTISSDTFVASNIILHFLYDSTIFTNQVR